MKTYDVTFEYYDYFFLHASVVKYASVFAENEDDARKKAYWKFGDLIDIIAIEEYTHG